MNGDVTTFSRTTSIQTAQSGILFSPVGCVTGDDKLDLLRFELACFPNADQYCLTHASTLSDPFGLFVRNKPLPGSTR